MKPIAWYDPTNGTVSTDKDSPLFTPLGQVLPLYTKQEDGGWTPERLAGMARLKAQQDSRIEPQRPWVGLTEEERKKIWNVGEKKDQALRAALIQTIREVETKLKERNT